MKRLLFLGLSLVFLISITEAAKKKQDYVPEEGSAEVGKKTIAMKSILPYDQNLKNVLIIGDSISIGYTKPTAKLLEGKFNVFHNPGNAQGTTHSLTQIDNWLKFKKWDIIHFNWGLHDLKHVKVAGTSNNSNDFNDPQQADIETYEKNLKQLVSKLKQSNAKLIFATTTPYPDGVRPARKPSDAYNYNQVGLNIMKQHKIAVNDLYTLISPNLKKYQKPVNVHFKPEGSALLAEAVAGMISKYK
jgi:acyl-CoA thioesterase-1